MTSMRAHLRRCIALLKSSDAVAAVEFALISPLLILILMIATDFGMAYNAKLKLLSALAAGAQYIQVNGTSLTSSSFANFSSAVSAVVTSTGNFPTTPTVSVAINNTTDGSAAGTYYCVSSSPPTWTKASSSTSVCSANLTAGQFVTLSVSLTLTNVFPGNPIAGSVFPLSESIIVRVK